MAGRGRIAGTFWVAIIDGFRLVPSRSWRHLSQVPERLQIGPRLDSAMWPLFDCDTWCAAQGVRSIDIVVRPRLWTSQRAPSRARCHHDITGRNGRQSGLNAPSPRIGGPAAPNRSEIENRITRRSVAIAKET
jgi:hypothetical protein